MAERPSTQRDAVCPLQSTWRTVRLRASKSTRADAAALPVQIEDEIGSR
jgi:hypothetical protein